jgi:CubicO group peptidase (beta-lactamase class C family)
MLHHANCTPKFQGSLERLLPLAILAIALAVSACPAAQDAGSAALARASVLVDAAGVHPEASGSGRLDGSMPVSEDSCFHIGSNTKAMTATLLAMLVEDELLDWDTTVAEVWPAESVAMHADNRSITLHELLTHRAGIQPFTAGTEWQGLPELTGDNVQQRRDFSLLLLGNAPASARGEFVYSNAGYGIASAMAEELTGESWEGLMTTHLFEPLEMRVHVGWPLDLGAEQPMGYLAEDSGLRPFGDAQGYRLAPAIASAGDLCMPIADYGKFLQLHLQGLAAGSPLLSQAGFAKLHEPLGNYACGWIIVERNGDEVSTHDGSAGSFYMRGAINRTKQYAVAAVVNSGGDKATALVQSMIEECLAESSSADADPPAA